MLTNVFISKHFGCLKRFVFQNFVQKTLQNMELHIADYIIFVLALLLSAGVGIYYAIKPKIMRNSAHNTGISETNEFLMGGRKMPIIPVALSVLVTFLSGIALLGIPAEIYYHGKKKIYDFVRKCEY